MPSMRPTPTAKRGRPRVDSVAVTVRLPESYLVALNAAIAREGDRHTRPQAVRFILRDWLRTQGHLDETTATVAAGGERSS